MIIILLLLILIFLVILGIFNNKNNKEGFENIKLLVIICSKNFDTKDCENIKILNDYLLSIPNIKVEYCGITHDIEYFKIFEHIITFKYKIVNTKPQLSKICDFISENKSTFDYNYFIKTRPEIKCLNKINFDMIDVNCISARVRDYKGPEKIKYGLVGPIEMLKLPDITYAETEQKLILDDKIYIFSNNIVNKGAFNKLPNEYDNVLQDEWFHTKIFNERHIPIKVVGINTLFTKYNVYSGDLNM